MAFSYEFLQKRKRQGTIISGSYAFPLDATESKIRVSLDLGIADLRDESASVEFTAEVYDQTLEEWTHLVSAIWNGGPDAEKPTITINANLIKGKKVRGQIDTKLSERTVGMLIEGLD